MANKLIEVEIKGDDIINTVLKNSIKMLINRGLLTGNYEKYFKDASSKVTSDLEFKIKEEKKTYIVKFIYTKLTTIRKIPGIEDFLNANKDAHKIIIVKDITQKAQKQFLEYPNTEVFWESELMINIVDCDVVPEHIVLTPEEKDKCMEDYQIKKKDMAHIYASDPVARYYNMKVGDVVKILRPSITSGYAVTYRIVVPGI